MKYILGFAHLTLACLAILYVYLFFRYQQKWLLSNAILFLLTSFFLALLRSYQNLIRKIVHDKKSSQQN
jgi:hypothetical protein